MSVPARLRRIQADYDQIRVEFQDHKYITVRPVEGEPPEKYHVTYRIPGIYADEGGTIQFNHQHEVDILLHADYPRYKPICSIQTPIWHPNFRDGQICIGDIWGAGESIADIIYDIGDMIQYRSWNATSPLSAEAANWAIENKEQFPVGKIDLRAYSEKRTEKYNDKIVLDGAHVSAQTGVDTIIEEKQTEPVGKVNLEKNSSVVGHQTHDVPSYNDFDISAEELAGVTYVPTADRFQNASANIITNNQSSSFSFSTILKKGVLWALIGTLVGILLTEMTGMERHLETRIFLANLIGEKRLATAIEVQDESNNAYDDYISYYRSYCQAFNLDADDDRVYEDWVKNHMSSGAKKAQDRWLELNNEYNKCLDAAASKAGLRSKEAYQEKYQYPIITIAVGLWSAVISLCIGAAMGFGEGFYYGSKEQALKYALIGAGISVALGFLAGVANQEIYGTLVNVNDSILNKSLARGLGWSVNGAGIGLAVGLIKPDKKRIIYCVLGGFFGAFLGGFLFNYIAGAFSSGNTSRCVGILIMGLLIGLFVGALEQVAKQAWLKVIRGEFEGKEYLIFNADKAKTTIGNNSQNTIVLFKDKLVSPHHCSITLDSNRYYLEDEQSAGGTFVNGRRITRQLLKKGDAIGVGNSVLVFQTK